MKYNGGIALLKMPEWRTASSRCSEGTIGSIGSTDQIIYRDLIPKKSNYSISHQRTHIQTPRRTRNGMI